MSSNSFALSLDIPEATEGNVAGNPLFQPLTLDFNIVNSGDTNPAMVHNTVDPYNEELEKIKEEFKNIEDEDDEDHGHDDLRSCASYDDASCLERIKNCDPPNISFNFDQGTISLEVPDFS